MQVYSIRPTDYTREDIKMVVEVYSKELFRICFAILMNRYDAEDALQDTFVAFLKKAPVFNSEEHMKAWLITVSQNKCKNMLGYKNRHTHLNYEDLQNVISNTTHEEESIINAFASLPQKIRIVMVLHFVEGYTAKDISKMIGISESAIWKQISKGRNLLKIEYEE